RSHVGEGTTFEVYLPEHIAVAPLERPAAAVGNFGTGQRILFIDDEAVIGGAASLFLQRHGFSVVTHTDPRAALEAFTAKPDAFDLVVTDLTMPHLDGVEVARQVARQRPGMPVLLATGQPGAWAPEALRAVGIRGLLTKPLTVAKLTRAVSDALASAG
ncbi:MAG TPA: response regulator, partial [Opitutaceae bacterium]